MHALDNITAEDTYFKYRAKSNSVSEPTLAEARVNSARITGKQNSSADS